MINELQWTNNISFLQLAKNSKNIIERDVLLPFLPRVVATLYTIDDNDASHQDDHKLDKLEWIEKNVRC